MILRSLTKHVNDQNWFAVAIDFLIVVAGVFVGVQVCNWNQSLQQRQIYEEAFDRVIVELQINLESLETEREIIGARLPIVQQALEDLRACRTDGEAQSHIEAAFAPLGSMSSFNIDTKALDQLINNDIFLPFQTPDIRKQFMALSTSLNTTRRQSAEMIERETMRAKDTSHIIQPGPLTLGVPDQVIEAIKQGAIGSSELVRGRKLIVPLAQACKDEAFLSGFYVWEDVAYFQSIVAGLVSEGIRNNLEMLERLAKETKAPTP